MAWNKDRNNRQTKVDWQFKTARRSNQTKTVVSETINYTMY